jgi:Fur family ferric uptake transcriptional regulator
MTSGFITEVNRAEVRSTGSRAVGARRVEDSVVIAGAGPAVRSTRQRAAVAALLEELEDFRSAQEVHDLLRHRGERVGLTTVYRSLQMLADAHEVDVLRTADGETAYRRCSRGHHHHLVCRTCGRTVEVDGPAVERWAGRVAAENGFTDVSHTLEIFGTCTDCSTGPG